ncbi:lysophospholipid acyltransferase family protein [Qipengyuania sp. MTN3-11]|uniref:lysophospholipid acyltransferase family protein n=1 Tax=Qipengyuania sp. MTN3-11 TaxID=3056557 RepID=UPI0036F32768
MVLLRNLAFYLAFYLGSIPITLSALAMLPFGERRFRAVVKAWSGYHRWCVVNLLGCRVRIEGVQPAEPVLFAVKHESFFEAIDAPYLFDHPGVFAKEELFRIWGWAHAGAAYGLIKVERNAGARALMGMIREAKRMTAAGRPLVIFPEGTRVPHGERRHLQAGFAGLYKMLGLPVVPVAVESGPLYHRGLKRKGTITYRFAEPIPPGLDRRAVELRVLDAINALNSPIALRPSGEG